jgi:SAM-dependent methyltransferase
MITQFDPKDYWESRLQNHFDLKGVGDIGLPQSYNELLYRVRGHAFRRALKFLHLKAREFDVLDIGSGIGFYIDQLSRLAPHSLTGSDLTDAAVEKLRGRYPQTSFIQCDIGSLLPPALSGRQFDLVTAMDMLFHIVDDQHYATAFDNFAKLIKPGGWLIFSDNLMRVRKEAVPHQVSRAESEVRRVLDRTGFKIKQITPMFVLMNDPVRSQSRLLRKTFSILYRSAARGERIGKLIGGLVYPIERVAIRSLSRGPSTEIVVCRKSKEQG